MVEFNRVIDGLARYLNNNVYKNFNDWQEVLARIAVGRIIGESAALIFTAGTNPVIPDSLFSSASTLRLSRSPSAFSPSAALLISSQESNSPNLSNMPLLPSAVFPSMSYTHGVH